MLGAKILAAHYPGVETPCAGVQWGAQTAKRVLTIAEVVWIGFLIATVLLITASTLLIANTIRLSIFSRRREIEVMKLVGATNWFVRGPFMLEGLICGLGGSILAVILLVLGKEIALPSILPHIGGGSDVHALPVRPERALAARRGAPPGGGRLRPHPQALPPGLAPSWRNAGIRSRGFRPRKDPEAGRVRGGRG